MSYDLNGKKYILSINVKQYDLLAANGRKRDRDGSEIDESNVVETFQDKVRQEMANNLDLLLNKLSLSILRTLIQNFHGFEVMERLTGRVTINDAKRAIKDSVNFLTNHHISNSLKMLTIILMGHGGENDM